MEIEQLSREEWGEALPSSGFEVFHTPAALGVLEEHTAGELKLYGGFKGDQPVGLFPVVVQDRAVGRAILSPPPGFAIPRLGPIVMPTSPKRRKQEQVNGRFAEQVLEELDVDASMTLFRTVCPTAYPDPRPYVWSNLSLDTSFTYHLDVEEDTDEMLKSFSKSLRREVRDGKDLDVELSVTHVSRALKSLRERDLVELLVPEERRKGRVYGITEQGQEAWELIQAKDLSK
ncbi:hypothetical protein HALDL1_10795 [Halobacterium sp. DL1]|jgi:DNA-binding transcriptional ArsR family regulator|nr:hypothetical protein HALDL1_10795 [Halobacterium sp. DL1]